MGEIKVVWVRETFTVNVLAFTESKIFHYNVSMTTPSNQMSASTSSKHATFLFVGSYISTSPYEAARFTVH